MSAAAQSSDKPAPTSGGGGRNASNPGAGAVFAPGNHDGGHLGHQARVRAARSYADAHGLRAVALTFDPHAASLVAPERAPTPLTTIARRSELLLKTGANDVIVQPFSREFANLSAESFLQALIA